MSSSKYDRGTSLAGILRHVASSALDCALLMAVGDACATDTLKQLQTARDAYIEEARVSGIQDEKKAAALEVRIESLLSTSEGELRARTLFELATIQRLTWRFDVAARTYELAAAAAQPLGLQELIFDAWMGVARSHAYGTKDHGAAAAALVRAQQSTGTSPSPKQSYELADYSSQLEAERGELDSALMNGMEALRLARSDSELFYAQQDIASVLLNFAESCDYKRLADAKTSSDQDDP